MAVHMSQKISAAGLRELSAIEHDVAKLTNLGATQRSRLPLLGRLLIAYPGLQASSVSKLLSVTPQGARKLLAALPTTPAAQRRLRAE